MAPLSGGAESSHLLEALSMSSRTIQAKLAAETRHRPDQDHTPLRKALKAEQLAEHITRAVSEWPPLDPEQRDRLASLLGAA